MSILTAAAGSAGNAVRAVDGKKTYIVMILGMLLTAWTQGPQGLERMDLGAWLAGNPDFIQTQLSLLLAGTFRSALRKVAS